MNDKKIALLNINDGNSSMIEILSNPHNKPLLSLLDNVGLIDSHFVNVKNAAEEIKSCIASIEKSRYALSSKNP